MLKAEDVPELSKELAALFTLGQAMAPMQPQAMQPQAMAGWLWGDPEDKLREYLERARALAAKFGPDSLSVGVVIPFGVQISLTWDVKDRPEGQTGLTY